MKHLQRFTLICLTSIVSFAAYAQTDTSLVKKDTLTKEIVKPDTVAAVTAPPDSVIVAATPMNCYKQWLDAFTERGTKPLTDGVHEVVIAFKSKESCHCYMGKVEVAAGKLKAPLYVQTEGGEYKTFVAMGKKLDPEFLTVQGDALWNITNGMSALFETVEKEYGRVFFYKSVNKSKQTNKEAPSPADLLK